MTRFLAARNAPLSSVKAVVLTHHHRDDRAAAMRKGRPALYPPWQPPVLHLVLHFLRKGMARIVSVGEASGSSTRKSWTCRAVLVSSTQPHRRKRGPEPG
jgi:hypothetical protein